MSQGHRQKAGGARTEAERTEAGDWGVYVRNSKIALMMWPVLSDHWRGEGVSGLQEG